MNKSRLMVGSAVLIGCVLAGEMVLRHTGSKNRGESKTAPPAAPAEIRVDAPPAPPIAAPTVEAPLDAERAQPIAAATPEAIAPHQAATAPVARVRAQRPPDIVPGAPAPIVPVEVARLALSLVGADPEAEAVWTAAINDPSLSAHARKDLIEDLNEDGFADPRHVTIDELPLVMSRLALIEEMAPDAMDPVNADAFAEAYKDLANIYLRLTNP